MTEINKHFLRTPLVDGVSTLREAWKSNPYSVSKGGGYNIKDYSKITPSEKPHVDAQRAKSEADHQHDVSFHEKNKTYVSDGETTKHYGAEKKLIGHKESSFHDVLQHHGYKKVKDVADRGSVWTHPDKPHLLPISVHKSELSHDIVHHTSNMGSTPGALHRRLTDIHSRPEHGIHENIDLSEAKLLATHTSKDGTKTAKVYHDKEWDEHVVKHYTNGKHHKDADYHTDDASDAHGTAKLWIKENVELYETNYYELVEPKRGPDGYDIYKHPKTGAELHMKSHGQETKIVHMDKNKKNQHVIHVLGHDHLKRAVTQLKDHLGIKEEVDLLEEGKTFRRDGNYKRDNVVKSLKKYSIDKKTAAANKRDIREDEQLDEFLGLGKNKPLPVHLRKEPHFGPAKASGRIEPSLHDTIGHAARRADETSDEHAARIANYKPTAPVVTHEPVKASHPASTAHVAADKVAAKPAAPVKKNEPSGPRKNTLANKLRDAKPWTKPEKKSKAAPAAEPDNPKKNTLSNRLSNVQPWVKPEKKAPVKSGEGKVVVKKEAPSVTSSAIRTKK